VLEKLVELKVISTVWMHRLDVLKEERKREKRSLMHVMAMLTGMTTTVKVGRKKVVFELAQFCLTDEVLLMSKKIGDCL
jgi:hypothetical protein